MRNEACVEERSVDQVGGGGYILNKQIDNPRKKEALKIERQDAKGKADVKAFKANFASFFLLMNEQACDEKAGRNEEYLHAGRAAGDGGDSVAGPACA